MARFRTLFVLSIALSLMGCDASKESQPNKDVVGHNLPGDRVSLKIDFGERRDSIDFHADLKSGMTVFDLLKAATDAKQIALDASGEGETAFVKSIGGIVGGADGNQWWLFFVNDEMGKVGSGVFKMKANDRVTWRLGTYK